MTPKPFISRREVILSDPFDAYVVNGRAIQDRYTWQLWPMARMERYIDMLCEFGFNSIQLSELAEDYGCVGYRLSERQLGDKLHAVSRYAKSKGMTRSLFVWGSGATDVKKSRGKLLDWTFFHPCPCVKGGNAALDAHYRKQARHAPHFDHIVTHWGDPGGCRGGKCTIRTTMELHNRLAGAFRKRNGDIATTFSLWVMHMPEFGGRWPGYESVRTILDAGILPPDVGLAQHGRFRLNEAKTIAAAGRRAGVWGWYLADDEVMPSIHVHKTILGEYFNAMPPSAGRLLEWHSIDSNCHALNVHNLYLAGQLLIDPTRIADALLAEYCRRAFGKAGDGFLVGLRAIDQTRCQTDYQRLARLLTGLPWKGASDEYERPAEHLKIVSAARKVVDKLRPDARHKPDLPLAISAGEFLTELQLHLRAIEQYARWRIAFVKEAARGEPIDPARLPRLDKPGKYMTQFEYKLAQEHLEWHQKAHSWPARIGL